MLHFEENIRKIPDRKTARLHDCMTARPPAFARATAGKARPHEFTTARLHDCKTARPHDCMTKSFPYWTFSDWPVI